MKRVIAVRHILLEGGGILRYLEGKGRISTVGKRERGRQLEPEEGESLIQQL